VWVAVVFVLRRVFVARCAGAAPIDRDLASLFACTIAFSLALGALTLARNGASLNHIIELWVMSAMLASIAFVAIGAKAYAAAAVLFVLPLLFTIGQLTRSNRIIGVVGLGARVERLALGSADEYAARVALRDRLRWLPRPVFVDDELLAQPWEANDDRYPAIVLDHVFYDAARAQGRLEHDGVVSLIERRHFGTVVAFTPPWYVYRAARSAGYAETARLPWLADSEAVVLVRSGTADANQIRRPTRRRTP